jgi:hypothetical protein
MFSLPKKDSGSLKLLAALHNVNTSKLSCLGFALGVQL